MVYRSINLLTAQNSSDVAFIQGWSKEHVDLLYGNKQDWDKGVTDLVTSMHVEATEAASNLHNMHVCITILRSKVSESDFNKICNSCVMPLTTVEVVNASDASMDMDVEESRINDHMPRAKFLKLQAAPTVLLGALVHYLMCQNLVNNPKYHVGQ